jgi:hypothetical protein
MTKKFKVRGLIFNVAALVALMALCLTQSYAATATTNSVANTNASSTAVSTNTNTGTGYSAFKIIADRNIFSANRSGRVSSRGSTRKPTKVDTFTLVGTVDYSKGLFAIFDGSSSSFRKTLKLGDAFGDFKITDIDLEHVTIANTNGAETVLRVGSQMRRVDNGEWERGSGSTSQVSKATESSGDKADAALVEDNSNNTEDSAPSAGTDEVLKRLMQKRKAEVKHESE